MVTAQRDYYDVLGVTRGADAKTIRKAFRELVMKYHPDRNKSPDAEERFKEIAEAYAVLSDPKKREDYDSRGFAGVSGFSQEDLFGGINFEEIFRGSGLNFDFGGFGGGLFSDFFGRRSRHRGPARGADVEVVAVIPLEKVNAGGDETVRFSRPIVCGSCEGSGAKPGTKPRQCEACNGDGQQVITQQGNKEKGQVLFRQITTCPVCHGQGQMIDAPCSDCNGRGRQSKEEELTVKIPAGAEEGLALRIPRHGLPSGEPGGDAGDLYVIVRTAPDSRFTRRGIDLWSTKTLSLPDAVLGKELDLETLSGHVSVTIPAGTQPGEVLRLRGKGLVEPSGTGYGDLNLRLFVHVPERLTKQERKLYEQLRELEKSSR